MITLRNLKPEDAENMLEWMHDKSTAACFRKDMTGMTKEKVLAFIEQNTIFREDSENRHYAIADAEDTYLGTISLKEINLADKNAEYAIALRAVARGNGVAEQATRQLLHIAFEELGLERVYLNVLADNKRAVRFYEKIGFKEEGTFRSHLRINGKLVDLKWYGILKDEYKRFGE